MAGSLDDQGIRLRLLRLALLHGGEVMQKDLKPTIDSPTRAKLEGEGLLEPDCFAPSPQGRRVRWLKLTDRGWGWLADKFAGDVRSTAQCGRELSAVLGMLRDFLQRDGLTFGEMVARYSAAVDSTPTTVTQVREACLRLQALQQSQRLRLAAVRAELPNVSRSQFDEAILQLTRDGDATLYRMDDPLEIQQADRDAAFKTFAGEERHLIYLRDKR
jgi:hypothetical protein